MGVWIFVLSMLVPAQDIGGVIDQGNSSQDHWLYGVGVMAVGFSEGEGEAMQFTGEYVFHNRFDYARAWVPLASLRMDGWYMVESWGEDSENRYHGHSYSLLLGGRMYVPPLISMGARTPDYTVQWQMFVGLGWLMYWYEWTSDDGEHGSGFQPSLNTELGFRLSYHECRRLPGFLHYFAIDIGILYFGGSGLFIGLLAR